MVLTLNMIDPKKPKIAPEDMTSKDYYFDSYAHFGIHEVCKKYQDYLSAVLTCKLNQNVRSGVLTNTHTVS